MPEVAQATITVTPVLEGAQQTLTEELTQAATPAGDAAGTAAGKSMGQSIGKGMTSAGKGMTKYVTAPIMAIGAASAAAWKEVDTGLDTIVEKTGASGTELESMQQIMNNLATTIPTDFATAGSAIGEVNTRFGVTGDELEDLSGQFLKFAKINNQDVSNSVDSVSKMMAAMGVETEDAGKMLDALNTVGQKTGVDVGYLSDTVAANAAQFKQMGLSAEESVALLGSMSMAGLDSSTAMMGLKTAMKNATEDGVSMTDALSSFEDIMNSNASESDKLAAAYELFGTRAGAAIYNAVSNGTLDLNDFTTYLGDFEGSVNDTFTNTQDPMDQFHTILNQLRIAGYNLVQAVGPALSEVLGAVAGVIERMTEAWNGLSPEMQSFILKAIGIAAVIGPILMIGGKVVGGVSKLTGGLGGLIGKIGGIGGAAGDAAGPVASAGGSFASMAGSALQLIAMAGSFVLVALGIKMIADAAISLSAAGGPAIATFFGMIAAIAGLMLVASALGPALTAGALGIGVFGAAVLGIGVGIGVATWGISKVIDAVGRLVQAISDNAPEINTIISQMGESIGGVMESIGSAIGTVIEAISGGLATVLDSVAGVIESFGSSALNAGEGFSMLADAVKGLVNDTGFFDLAGSLAAVADGVKDINKSAKDSGDNADKVTSLSDAFNSLALNGLKATVAAANATTAITTMGVAGSLAIGMLSNAMSNADLSGSMATMMSNAYNVAQAGINNLHNLFRGTKFNFNQHIALPHFSMTGNFNAQSKSVPTVTAQWYARAAEYGALFKSPTIIGVGDASQPELLLGEEKLKELVKGAGGITQNFYVSGADNPELWARRAMREAHILARAT